MALIVITIADGGEGPAVSVQGEPGFSADMPETQLTPAQGIALVMLKALEDNVKKEKGLIEVVAG
jgi:hypothetical protein